ncbi:MAG TPA: transglutaminase family protein [Rhodospirillaceae bacterium]|nr:transglutaminase family protein [Rhodospirillaceae bacterium]
MVIVYRVRHVTTYGYAEPVLLAHHLAHLTPRNSAHQTCLRSLLRIEPVPAEMDERVLDYYGNPVTFFALRDPHARLLVQATSKVEVRERPIPEAQATASWEDAIQQVQSLRGAEMLAVADCQFDSPYVGIAEGIQDYALASFPARRPLLECLLDLMFRIHRDFTYDPKATTLATPLAEVLAKRRGVCQDFAHFGIACVRSMGLSARYVSGYLLTKPPPGAKKLRGSDASHAWMSVYLPDVGWIDFDPTNNCIPKLDHVTLGWGRDYDDVSPLRGVVLGGGDHSLKVGVDVEPLNNS